MKDIEIIEKAIQKYEKETYSLDETEYEESKAFDHALMEAIVLARADEREKLVKDLAEYQIKLRWDEKQKYWITYSDVDNRIKQDAFQEVQQNCDSAVRSAMQNVLEWLEKEARHGSICSWRTVAEFKEKFLGGKD